MAEDTKVTIEFNRDQTFHLTADATFKAKDLEEACIGLAVNFFSVANIHFEGAEGAEAIRPLDIEGPIKLEESPKATTPDVHAWFELTYAEYLAIPRTVLQSMPDAWQRRFVQLMTELDETFDWRRNGCWVKFKDSQGRFMGDELGDYQRGRRKVTPEEVKEITNGHNRRFTCDR